MVCWTSKPGSSSDGAGKWRLAEARRGIILLHRRRREPRSFWPSHAALPVAVQKSGCGPVLAAGHVGQAGEKVPRRSGWPDTGRKRHRTATGAWEWSGESRPSPSFKLLGYHRLALGACGHQLIDRNLNFDKCCHRFNIPRLMPSKALAQPAVAPCTAHMFTTRVCPNAHRTLLALGEILPVWSVSWRVLVVGLTLPRHANIPHHGVGDAQQGHKMRDLACLDACRMLSEWIGSFVDMHAAILGFLL